jgi:mannosyl-oligosaccharide alpha-1,2-mannosidase
VLVSEIGSLRLEFTHLSQITGDPCYFDAVQRVMDVFEEQQDKTNLPGMWPVAINVKTGDYTGFPGFTIGGMADSLYEYLPKVISKLQKRTSIKVWGRYMLLGGATQHLGYFAGGMAAIAAKKFQNEEELSLARS